MRTIIAGSRQLRWWDTHTAIKRCPWEITEVVSGCAKGPDTHGKSWAEYNDIPVKHFPADWSKHGRSAGYIRNGEMAIYADAMIAVWDGKSRGAKDMINKAKRHGLRVYVYRIDAQGQV